MDLARYYNIVYDQQFSPSGKYLATSDAYGRVAVFSLQTALNHSPATGEKTPLRVLKVQDGPLYSLTNVGSLLACGGCDDIKLWKWEELISPSADPQPLHTLTPQSGKTGTTDTNSMVYDAGSATLYSGGGDNTVMAWDVNTATVKRVFSGHTGYIHCLCLKSGGGGSVLSGAEDGTVKMWDPASPTAALTWKPAKSTMSGQWVGCVAVDSGGDWMVCGGSMAPSVFRISSTNKMASLSVPANVVTQAAIFTKDRIITAGSESVIRHWAVNGEPLAAIITAGSESVIRHWAVNGELLAAVPGGHSHFFSLAHNSHHKSKQFEVLTVSGDSSEVHVFTDFGYRAFSLTVTN